MSERTFINHPLRISIDTLRTFREDPSFYAQNISSDEQFSYARDKIFGISDLIKNLFDHTPSVLVSLTNLNNLQANIQTVIAEVNNFTANKNPGHLTNAANAIDQNIIPVLCAFPPSATEPSAYGSLATDLLSSANRGVATLQEHEIQLEKRLLSLVQLSTDQHARLETLTEAVAAQKADALAVTAQVNKAYSEHEQARTEIFTATIENFKNEQVNYDEDIRSRANLLILALEKNRDDAARIVQVVGNIGVTGNYQKIADLETKSANVWRRITVGIFCIGMLFAGATFIKLLFQGVSQETILSAVVRLLFAIAITTPAWYAAKESARHRSTADRARQTELELASLGPFIELLSEEKKSEIRELLVKQYFGNGSDPHETTGPLPISELKDVAIEAIKAVSKAR